ncbi:S1 RNA-binding domain-containing protein [bacterium]|nr:S1 RNA-binding domain-containing protein [bacterium]
MDTLFPVDLGRIAQDLQIRKVQVESVVELLDEGNTVPFVTRYRKERTGGLNEVQIREIRARVQKIRDLNERKQTILKAIEAQGKLTDDLRELIRATENPKKLEDLYLPYKPKKRTKAGEAREKGFEPLALKVWNRDESLSDITEAAKEYLNPEKGVETVEHVLEGVKHILAEAISELALIRDAARKVVWRSGKIATVKNENVDEAKGTEYRDYFAYSEPLQNVPPHRVLAFNRGEKEGVLKIRLEVPTEEFQRAVLDNLPLEGHPQSATFREAALDALERLLRPSLEREVRRDLSESAEKHAVEVFARNLRSLLLQPPVAPQVILAIDPGFRTGCKVAVLDEHGNLLEHTVIYPHPPQNRRHEAKMTLKDLVGKHKVEAVAIGNGTACRETEELVAEMIAEGTHFHESGITVENYVPPVVETPAAEPESTETPEPESTQTAEVTASETPDEIKEPTASADTAPTESPAESGELTDASIPPISGGAPEEDETPLPDPATQLPEPETAHEAQLPAPTDSEETLVAALASESSWAPLDVSGSVESASSETSTAETAEGASGETTIASTSDTPPAAQAFSSLTSLPKGLEPKEEKPKAEKKPPKDKSRGDRRDRGPKGPKPQPPQPPPPPAPHVADPVLADLSYVIVNESGASVYSTSNIGREEFPDYDATLRGVISIGRRLLDPLSELVKIDPQNIGVGLYQHDVHAKTLKETLESIVESCVNFVAVDMNTASVPLLRHVAGLNQLTARRIVERRQEKGPYTSRDQIQEIEGVGPATFTQAAGFLRIHEPANPLDNTWVHPESYETATRLLENLGFALDSLKDKEKIAELREKLSALNLEATAAELGVGVPTLDDICAALARPGRDPREDLPKPIFKRGILKLEDLQSGMELKGTVLNVVDFGAFVDIGLKDSGLVHISQLANRYVKSPHDVVSVGDVVTVWVLGVDNDRKRVSLTMVAPGTERERPRPGDGPRRDRGPGSAEGQSRGPRRDRPAGGGGGGDRRGPGRDEGGQGGQYRGEGQGGGRSRYGRGSQQGQHRSGGYSQGQQRPNRPSRPAEPAKPLSEKEITGAVPLRSFGQLKQFFDKRDTPQSPGEAADSGAPESPSASSE